MIRRYLGAALVVVGLAGAADAAAVQYNGTFDDGHIYGWFSGISATGGNTITGAELKDFHITFDNRNYSPGQYYHQTSSVRDFLFQDFGDGLGKLSGWANLTIWESWCGGWMQEPCLPGEEGGWYVERDWYFTTDRVAFDRNDLTPAPVPVPGSLPLIAGGIGALALLRRRQKVNV
ncbi:MAG: VPLPA-CTERM sorting domain-containing protein [Paracoccus sp. (in: a-proteobacteria)]|nr:VPLPA-CTERM sorting domain-containing protein [Paracoccus sp. (in: a-proteobacteria)]